MQLEIYTEKKSNNNTCYLCGCTLKEYVEKIPNQYMEYEVQRGIVPNVYLDKIIETILNNDNIPTITLISEQMNKNGECMMLNEFKILDGLQRTYRIKSIWECLNLFDNIENKDELINLSRLRLAKKYKKELKEINSDVKIFERIINEYRVNGNTDRFIKYFNENIQWFEIWQGLSPEQQIDKMLILNAGHKAMTVRHQLELLYLNVLPYLDDICNTEGVRNIIREKEKTDTVYSKERNVGEYYFSHLISATLAFDECKPKTTNTDLVKKIQEDNLNGENKSINLNYDLLQSVLKFWISLDKILEKYYGSLGVRWLSRETVIVGIFAALGKYSEFIHSDSKQLVFGEFIEKITDNKVLNIDKYDKAKNYNMDISKINIGNVTKKAVFNAIYDLMSGSISSIEWDAYFGGDKHE
ncbi:hypothetical protein FDG50_03285 [Clostridium botulinum]|uniref:hypothetical protein n=1 Tax=Clostridium botulinum TaxID=1491 RepID=UPI001401092E|nr:hypothetical protein [Clostridium botulinum]MBY6836553.1 hypothetical protein [Clostridium botulinum]NFG64175.1 hypothetical protein [Clostridium botulinum]NFQ23168.1 hypothetical protein [Clostridium botulinum]